MTLRHIKIRTAAPLVLNSREAAWRRRTTISALVREGLGRYVKHGSKGATRLAKNDPGSGEFTIRFRIDDELWQAAIAKAIEEGEVVSSIIRRLLQRTVELEGVE